LRESARFCAQALQPLNCSRSRAGDNPVENEFAPFAPGISWASAAAVSSLANPGLGCRAGRWREPAELPDPSIKDVRVYVYASAKPWAGVELDRAVLDRMTTQIDQ
jgi:hypothetical protein